MQIPFDPDIHLGPLTLAWHGVFTAVGIFFGVWLAVKLARERISEDDGYAIATWGVIGGIAGARLLHVADRWSYYAEHLEQIPLIWTGGIAVWGAVIGGALSGLVVAIRRKVPIGATADAAAPGIGLGLGLGRIGDIINGEHWALPCASGPGLCVEFTHPNTLGQGAEALGRPFSGPDWQGPVHLVVAYEMAWDLLGAWLAMVLRTRLAGIAPAGLVFWLWLAWYSIGRIAFGALRVGDPTPILGFRQDQLIGLICLAVALPVIAALQLRLLPRVKRPEPIA